MSSESDVQALKQRISVVRKEIEALTEQVRAAKERLRQANAKRKESPQHETAEQTLRGGLTWAGGLLAVTGAVILFAGHRGGLFADGELFDRIQLVLLLSVPLLLGLALLARARFAKYDADKQDLDGDIF